MPVALTQFPRSGTILVTQGYGGDTSHGINPWSVDFSATSGTSVLSVLSGTIVSIRTGSFTGDTSAGGYGNFITILHTGGFYATYAHLTTIGVSVGQSVGAGTPIGTSGSTGNTIGAHIHLHFGTSTSGSLTTGSGDVIRAFGGGDSVPPAFFAAFFPAAEVGPGINVNSPLSTDIFGTGNWGGSPSTDSDELHGTAAGNRIFGGSGPDRLFGEGGDDLLFGGTGQDYFDGGSGNDTVSVAYSTSSWTINLASNGTASADGLTETLVSVENIISGPGADTITTTSENINNIVDGGDGSDRVILPYVFGSGYSVSGTAANLVITGAAGTDTFQNIESFQFSNGTVKNAAELLTTNDDFTANTSTVGMATPGAGQVSGNIETTADRDWFRVQVTQGSTYTINLVSGSAPQIAPFLSDPEVYLYNSSGQFVDSNDDFGGLNSQLTFTATYTGNYFVGAGEHGDNATGTYRLSVSAGSTPTAPEISVLGNGFSIADGDSTPSSGDNTDFGSATQGGTAIQRTFTVVNSGTGALNISNFSLPSGFSIVESLSSSIPSGGNDAFTVQLNTGSTGTPAGDISFTTNDSDENPFNFRIAGTVNAPPTAPEISVLGNGFNIADGDTTPSSGDNTDFGIATQGGTAIQRTFTVVNSGTGALNISNFSLPSGFSIVESLSSSIPSGGNDTFTVQLNTGSAGSPAGDISFTTNDSDENPFDFRIAGTVNAPPTAPEISVLGNGFNIADGDTTPSTGDNTDFGSVTQGGTAIQRTFTVVNSGTGALNISNFSLPSGFSIVESLSSSIPSGGNDTFTLQLDATTFGIKSGQISFNSNDSDENPFNFSITGVINDILRPGSISINDVQLSEGDSRTKLMTFTVTRTAGTGAFSVNYATSDLNAKTSNNDYVAALGTLQFGANDATQTFAVTINGDTNFEASESFLVTLSGATNGAVIEDSQGVGVIINDDANRAPTLSAPDVSATRGQVLPASSLFAANDADGNELSYWFRDNTIAGGRFEYDGTPKLEGQTFGVSQSQLSHLTFRAGSSGSDSISLNLWDGSASSNVVTFNVNVAPNSAPTLSAADVLANRGQVIAAASLFSANDSDGDALSYWFFDNTPGGGSFEYDGVAKPAGQSFGVSQAQLSHLTFRAGANGSSDDIFVNAWDGAASSSIVEFHVNVAGNHAPTLSAPDFSATRAQVIPAANLFSASDSDGDALSYWFFDNTPGGGSFEYDGVAKPAGQSFGVSQAQLSHLTFRAGANSGSDDLFVNAWDGQASSPVVEFHVNVAGNHAPTLSAPDFSATRGQVIPAANLFSANDSDGDALSYWFFDNTPGGGSFEYDGVAKPAGQSFGVSQAQLSHLTFRAGANSGSDDLFVNAWDGQVSSPVVEFHVNVAGNHAPTLSAPDFSATRAQVIPAANLFSANDSDGDALSYWFFDNTPGGGSFEYDGVAKPAGQSFGVSQAQLSHLTFRAGANSGSDDLFVNAWDGQASSSVVEFHVFV